MKQRKSEQIILDIKRTILSGEYKPGDKLPSERELSQKHNVSRIPVREAMAQLTKENVIRTEPNIGNFIAETCDAQLLSHDIYQYSFVDHQLLQESMYARQIIETQSARLAAANATKEDVEAIQNYLFSSTSEFTKLKSGERNQFFQEDFMFHQSIAIASHSELQKAYMKTIRETISIHQFSSQQNDGSIAQVPDAHFRIYNAILSHDIEAAAMEMHNHIQWVINVITATT